MTAARIIDLFTDPGPDAAGAPYPDHLRCASCGMYWLQDDGFHTCSCLQARMDKAKCGASKQTKPPDRYENSTPPGMPRERYQVNAWTAARGYVEAFDRKRTTRGLYIVGPVGTGKTYLAAGILNALQASGKVQTGCFQDAGELLATIRRGMGAAQNGGGEWDDPTESELVGLCKSAQLLVLDDLARDRLTDFRKEILMEIINHRYNHELPTIYTANLPLFQYEHPAESLAGVLDIRAASRISETCAVVAIVGRDLRPPASGRGER